MDSAVFQICNGSKAGQRLTLKLGAHSFGRAPTCSVRIHSDDVSRLHCELQITPGGIVLRDLKSRNGTYLDGHRIDQPTMLSVGNRFRVGKLELELVAINAATEPAALPATSSTRRIDPSQMTLDELVQFDEDSLDIEPVLTDIESCQSPLDQGNCIGGTTILLPGQINSEARPPSSSEKPAEVPDTTEAAKLALRKMRRRR